MNISSLPNTKLFAPLFPTNYHNATDQAKTTPPPFCGVGKSSHVHMLQIDPDRPVGPWQPIGKGQRDPNKWGTLI